MSKLSAHLADIPSAPDWDRPGLSARGRAIARAAVEALLADRDQDGSFVPPRREWVERIVHDYDRSVGATSLQVRLGVRWLVRALEWLPLAVVGRASRMSRLPLAVRVHYLEALENHPVAPLTMLLVATKVPMLISAFESGNPLRLTGFDRPSLSARRSLPVRQGAGVSDDRFDKEHS